MRRKYLYLTLGISTILLSACSSNKPEYEYAIPSKVCDVRVGKDEMKSLLRAGESVEVLGDKAEGSDGRRICRVVVDKKAALHVSISRDVAEEDVARVTDDGWTDFRKFSPGGDVTSAGVASDGGIAWMKCQPKAGQPKSEIAGRPYTHLVLRVNIDGDTMELNGEERRADLEDFMRSYIPELVEVWCR
ncbi:hypothetical protein RGF97_15185 [Streptomyces roseicoloratus]|uniref:Lipoprotein n=1 Tax=Streptomyces roseicoloratus TaxID=2508722 RepID=A0ABY9RUR6_9ACTN|nr:hypothetical protein [Streptomyces roseicoloratus]WMX45926.1 hypothetical protein RGF97_15185 [Streptomyces roseicoloratus]